MKTKITVDWPNCKCELCTIIREQAEEIKGLKDAVDDVIRYGPDKGMVNVSSPMKAHLDWFLNAWENLKVIREQSHD